MLAPRFLCDLVASAAAAASAVSRQSMRRSWPSLRALQGGAFLVRPLLLLLVLEQQWFDGAASAALSRASSIYEERGLQAEWPAAGSEYVLGSGHVGGPRHMLTPDGQPTATEDVLGDRPGQMRNALYGEDFISYTEELRSFWLACQQENTAVATVRTNVDDLTGFAACAELNLELDDTWADIPEGTGQLGYRWVLYPREPVGADTHFRRVLSQVEARLSKLSQLLQKAHVEAAEAGISVPFDLMDGAIAIQYSSHVGSPKAIDQGAFLFSVTQGTGTVLGRLQYKSLSVKDKKIVSFPEITVGTDGELCGLVLLRSLLKRAQGFGIAEVRIRVESSNIPLLKAASCTGFRPVDITVYEGKAHHILVANPQLPLPAVADLKQKIATLDRMARHLALSYFQAQALRNLHQDPSHPPTPLPETVNEAEMDEPSKARDFHYVEGDISNFERLRTPAFIAGLGTIVLVVIAAFMWKRRKGEGASADPRKAWPNAKRTEEWYLSPPPHWRDRQHRADSVRESLSSEDSEEWKATGQLDG